MSTNDTLCLDAHSDIPFKIIREQAAGRDRTIATDFLDGMSAGGIDARIASIYLDDDYLPEMALRRALNMVEALRHEIDMAESMTFATTAADIRQAYDSGQYAFMLGLEGIEPLQRDLSMLDVFYRLGLRIVTVTHSRRNAAGDGSFFTPTRTGTRGGLSGFGVDLVERATDLGICLDVSHLNDPGFWDVMEFTDGPVIASHSNCRALRGHPRNLSDDQIQAIADAGGIIGIAAVGRFLVEEGSGPTFQDFVDHIEYAAELVGPKHVGVGFDFFEYLRPYLSETEQNRMPEYMPVKGLRSDSDVARLVPALAKRGFTNSEIEGIVGGNLLRVLEQVC
jgi:membrane dipeptidase